MLTLLNIAFEGNEPDVGIDSWSTLRAGPGGAALTSGLIYNLDMENGGFFPQEFTAAIISAGARARMETLRAGVPVFYRDWKRNLDVMEQPDGRKFEICFIAGAPRETNYRVIRELDGTAA